MKCLCQDYGKGEHGETRINPCPEHEAWLRRNLAAEREACAKTVEDWPTREMMAQIEIAAAIRARG